MRTSLAIQYLRAVAALAVVAYHAGQWIRSDVEVGAAGVDVFFVVSGFVMWSSTWGRPTPPADFLWRRAVRVAPLYWLATLAVAVTAAVSPGLFHNVTLEPDHLLRSLFFIPHLNPQGHPFPLLAPGWTLNYEAVFYLAFAVALLVRPHRRLAVLATILVPLACLGLLWVPGYRLFANPMLLQFLAGVLIARLWQQKTLPGAAAGAFLVLAAGVLFAASHFAGVRTDLFLRPFAWGVPAAALVIGALSLEAAGRLPSLPGLKRLGDASYSLYLVHYPVLALFNRAIGPTDPVLFFGLGTAISLAAGLAFHRFVEQPLLAQLRRSTGVSTMPAGAPDPQAARP